MNELERKSYVTAWGCAAHYLDGLCHPLTCGNQYLNKLQTNDSQTHLLIVVRSLILRNIGLILKNYAVKLKINLILGKGQSDHQANTSSHS